MSVFATKGTMNETLVIWSELCDVAFCSLFSEGTNGNSGNSGNSGKIGYRRGELYCR